MRRVRRADFLTTEKSFLPGTCRPGFVPGVSTYRAVQLCGASSILDKHEHEHEHEHDDYLSCPLEDAKNYFRQWHGALEDFPDPSSPRAPRADSRTVIPPKPKGGPDDLFG